MTRGLDGQAQRLRGNALRCEEMAARASPWQRADYLTMARLWRELADEFETLDRRLSRSREQG